MGVITIAELRRVTGLPSHRINYALNRFGPEPSGRIGISLVWAPESLPRILESIGRIEQKGKTE
jgi:hypothetical protein